jgi:hypothetical protein
MSSDIRKWQEDEKALALERQRMNEALARLGQVEAPVSYETETRGAARRCGRLVFALDLTSSREPGLREARIATAAMFEALQSIGADRLAVKLAYYRGRECKASGWVHDPAALKRAMEKLSCKAGYTQIGKVLRLALAEKDPLSGVVFIGDACEEEPEELYELAAELGEKNIPLYMFHDYGGRDTEGVEGAGQVFEWMAELSHGAYCHFGTRSAAALRELLSTVAAFSAAGIEGVKQVCQVTTAQARQLQNRLLLGPGGGK